MRRDLAVLVNAPVYAQPARAGFGVAHDRTARRAVIVFRHFSIDARFDRPALAADVALCKRQLSGDD